MDIFKVRVMKYYNYKLQIVLKNWEMTTKRQ